MISTVVLFHHIMITMMDFMFSLCIFKIRMFGSNLFTPAATQVYIRNMENARQGECHLPGVFWDVGRSIRSIFTDAATSSEKTEQHLVQLIGNSLPYAVLKSVVFRRLSDNTW